MAMQKLDKYLLNHIKQRNESFEDLESYAKKKRIPIIDPISCQFLMQLIRIKKPKRILEIGTAIGYSALRMNEAHPDARIVTIERDEQMYKKAVENIENFNQSQNINIIYGDALAVLNDLVHDQNWANFDVVFIDAAKAQYKRFFKLVKPILSDDGIIITDNVLFKGLVIGNSEKRTRLNKLAKKISEYNEWLSQLDDFSTSIVPIGDGIAISVRI